MIMNDKYAAITWDISQVQSIIELEIWTTEKDHRE